MNRTYIFIIVGLTLLMSSCLKPYSGQGFTLNPPENNGKIVSYRTDLESGEERISKITVTGNHYEMGYQQGYLLYKGVKKTTSANWLVSIADVFMGGMVNKSEFLSERKNNLVELLAHFSRKGRDDIPLRYMQQMQGVADGAIAHIEEIEGVSYNQLMEKKGKSLKERKADIAKVEELFENISGDRVMLVNIMFDTLMSIGYPLDLPRRAKMQADYDIFYSSLDNVDNKIVKNSEKALEMDEYSTSWEMHACDGVIVSGNAAENGKLYHSRSFMIPEMIGLESVYIECQPTNGYYKTLSLAVPGFIGCVTAMNEKGMSIGLDMVSAVDTSHRKVGMGSLLKIKAVLETSSTLATAIDKLEKYTQMGQSGVPWLFSLAGQVGARGFVQGCSTYKPDDWGSVVYEDSPSYGIARWGDWVDDRNNDTLLTSYNFEKRIENDKRELFKDGKYNSVLRFISPELTIKDNLIGQREVQCENIANLLTFSNVFVHPDIQWNKKTRNAPDHDSTYRHEKITMLARDLLEGRTPNLEGYKFSDDDKIGFEEMKYLVNYITPYKKYNPYWNVPIQKQRWNHKDGKIFPKETFDECIDFCGRYYSGKYVHGSRTVFDNANGKMSSVWGLWEQGWVDAQFDNE